MLPPLLLWQQTDCFHIFVYSDRKICLVSWPGCVITIAPRLSSLASVCFRPYKPHRRSNEGFGPLLWPSTMSSLVSVFPAMTTTAGEAVFLVSKLPSGNFFKSVYLVSGAGISPGNLRPDECNKWKEKKRGRRGLNQNKLQRRKMKPCAKIPWVKNWLQ